MFVYTQKPHPCGCLLYTSRAGNFEAGLLLIPVVLNLVGIGEPILSGEMSDWGGRPYHSPLTIQAGLIPIHFAAIADFTGLLVIVMIIFVRFLHIQRDQERASSELAGVMAHETAHVCAHHAAREMTRMNYAQLSTIPLIMMTGYSWTGYGIYEAAQFAVPITFLKFSRDFEAQADYLGVQYMYRAGYDPQAFISFFEKVQALEKRKPGMVAKAFADHPQTPDRIQHTQEEIARILPAKDEYTVTTSEFDDVKARLARIENKRRLTDTKGGAKPSLRRASTGKDDPNGQAGDSTSSSNGDDRPTLHRRDDQN